jgi:hypothetical protein
VFTPNDVKRLNEDVARVQMAVSEVVKSQPEVAGDTEYLEPANIARIRRAAQDLKGTITGITRKG